MRLTATTALCSLSLALAACAASPPPLIPLSTYLAKPQVQAPKISPDGKQLIALAPIEGVPNLMIAPLDDLAGKRALTRDTGRGLQASTIWAEQTFRWAFDNMHVVYMRDDKGDENWTLYSLDTRTGQSVRLTPADNVQVRRVQLSPAYPNLALFSMNDKDRRRRNYYTVDIVTGKIEPVDVPDSYIAVLFDDDFKARLGIRVGRDQSFIFDRPLPDGSWRQIRSVPPEDVPALVSNQINQMGGLAFVDKDGDGRQERILTFSSEGLDTTSLVELDLETGALSLVATDDKVDINKALVAPVSHRLQAYQRVFTDAEWKIVDPSVKDDFEVLKKLSHGDFDIESRSKDDRLWIVSAGASDLPTTYYLYDRDRKDARKLFVQTPQLAGLPLSRMHPVVTKSDDGFDLVSYISYPSWIEVDADGKPAHPVPTVVLVHGGPSDERVQEVFSPVLQWLNNRGLAVFAVNFRGSLGFGKAFMNAQNLEWGGKMNDDVVQQVKSLIDKGMIDSRRVGIFGGSYGGYETLAAMTLTPDVFACGAAVVGPANLETFIDPATIPPDWSIDELAMRIGDPRTEEGRRHLKSRSPINFAHQTKGRMLIVQGANDIRVPQRESDQMVAAMAKAGVEVTYLLYPDEGHGIIRQENNRSYMATLEAFFGKCLGVRSEPLTDQMEGSSVRVMYGADYIPGLKDAVARRTNDGLRHRDTSVTAAALAPLAGSYDLSGAEILVALEGEHLFITIPGQGKFELIPSAPREFFLRESALTISIADDALTLDSSGAQYRAARKR